MFKCSSTSWTAISQVCLLHPPAQGQSRSPHTETLGWTVPVLVTCWENRQLLTSLIHGWVTALLAFTWAPLSDIFDRLLNKVCLKFLFNISKTLIQQDVSSGVLGVATSAAVEVHSLPRAVFSYVLFFICDNSKVNITLKLCPIQHSHVLKPLRMVV